MSGKRLSSISDLQNQLDLLQKEYECEKEMYQQNTREAGIYRKVEQGVCWYPVVLGASRYNSLNQFTIEVYRQENEEIDHQFEYGRPVCFFKIMSDGSLWKI